MTQASVTLGEVGRFTDQQLIARLQNLVRSDQELGARLLLHLGEVDARGLYREQAYPSMFAYCVKELHMSEGQAYMRIQAARLARQYPLIVELFERGALHLSAIKLLAPHLTAHNHVQVLERASFRGKREIELLVAELAPKPDVPNRMRKLPESSRTSATRPSAFLDANTARSGSNASVAALLITQPIGATRALTGSGASIAGASVTQPMGATLPLTQPIDATPAVTASAATCAASRLTQPISTLALAGSGASIPAPIVTQQSGASPVPSALDARIAASPILEDQVKQAPVGLVERIAGPIVAAGPAAFALEPQRPRGSSVPLRPGRYKVELTAGQALHDKLEQLQELLRHRVPDGDLAVIVELAVDALIDKTMKQRCAQTRAPKKPRANDHASSPRTISSRYIPRAVVREVYARDDGRCTFVSSAGKRCSERGFLELHHHDVPFGRGGEATAGNLRLVCRAHNALFAERDYGVRFMQFKQLDARAGKATESLVRGESKFDPTAVMRAPKRRPDRTERRRNEDRGAGRGH